MSQADLPLVVRQITCDEGHKYICLPDLEALLRNTGMLGRNRRLAKILSTIGTSPVNEHLTV